MTSNKDLEKRIESLEKEVQHIKAALQYQTKNQKRNIDPQKTSAEKLNGRFALVGVIALVGAYISTGQIVPGII